MIIKLGQRSPAPGTGRLANTQMAGILAAGVLVTGFLAASLANAAGSPSTAAAPDPAMSTPRPLAATAPDALTAMADRLAKDGGAVVVTVADQPITQAEVADTMRALPPGSATLGFKVLYRRVVDQLISEKLAFVSGVKLGLDKDPDVRRRQRTASEHAVADAWINHEADAAVTEQALRARYEREYAGRPGPVEVRLRVIVVPTEAEAVGLIGKLRDGAAFDDMAKQFSRDGSAASGGDLGYVTLEDLTPEAANVAFALSPGQFTAFPVHTASGYFILRVEGRRQRGTPAFDDVRARLVVELRSEAATASARALTSDIKFADPIVK
jgi:peptidyl-prolyl cis-trans isomerase C